MKEGKLIGKIFPVALVLAMIAALLATSFYLVANETVVKASASSPIAALKWPLQGSLDDRTVLLDFGADWAWGECPLGVVKKHVGIDVSATAGENVFAPEAGTVRAVVYDSQWEYCVTIEHSSFTTVCWHVDPLVDIGDPVTKGEIIGTVADLGANTHLHFGVRESNYSNISNRGALPQGDCGGDPAFPEHFVDPKTLDYSERRLAVTPRGFDQMQDVLDALGYEYAEIPLESLIDLTSLQSYDVVFINCDSVYDPVSDTFDPIREFVSQGGAVYASDWAYEYIKGAFPGFADFGGHIAPSQTTAGNILDEGLKAYLGVETMPIVYDLDIWVPITYVSDEVTTYVSHTVSYDEATHPDTPAVIGFRYGKGSVVYTSFHNAAQDPLARKLLEYLVLIPITADIDAELENSMKEKGYNVAATFVDAIDEGETKSYNYLLTAKTDLIFGVNWHGSEVTLQVVCPDGTTYGTVSSSSPPLFIEVPSATPGIWTSTVIAMDIPYPQYPIVLAIGAIQAQPGPTVTWNCPLGGQPLIAPNPGAGRPDLSVLADCEGITASAGGQLWGIYYLVETGPQAGTWLWYIPGFVTSTLTQLEPGEYYWVVVSAPCTLTIPQG